jgi:hypothetical protein
MQGIYLLLIKQQQKLISNRKKSFVTKKSKTKVEKINFLAMPFRVFTLVCGFCLTTNYEFRLFDSFPIFFQQKKTYYREFDRVK